MAKTRRTGSGLQRYMPYVRTAYKIAKQGYKIYTKYNKKRQTDGIGVTNQYDRKTVYKKRRMPRRKRQRWVRFVKKVKAVEHSDNCQRSIVFNQRWSNSTAAGTQTISVVGMYGLNGTSVASLEYGVEDIYKIINNDPDVGINNSKISFKSCVLDVTMQADPSNTGTVEVDLYELFPKKNQRFSSVNSCINTALTDTPTIGAFYNAIAMNQIGVTPFQIPMLGMAFTIGKKVKYLLSPGQACTYQCRDPKNRMVDTNNVNDLAGTAYHPKYGSRAFLIVFKQTPAGTQAGQTLAVGATRTYAYTYEGCNTYKDGQQIL